MKKYILLAAPPDRYLDTVQRSNNLEP